MPVRAAFVYQNSRTRLAAEVLAGTAPDSTLLGQNHLAAFGVEAFVHDPLLTRSGVPARLGRLAWNLRELSAPWEVGRADVVFTPLATLFPLAARLRPGLATVVVNYGLCTTFRRSTPARRRLLAASLRSARTVVCLGASQSALTAEQTGARTLTVPLGIDERFWSPREPAGPGEPYVLAVGKDLARDYATLVEALAGIDAPARLAVYPRNLEGIRLPPNVTAAVVGPAELRELYAGAACVVLPQRREEFGYGSEGGGLTALLEAWAMGRPVVATERAIVRDYLAPETGVLVPPEDPAALREGIERVLGDPALARSLGAAARQRVEREHTTRIFAARLAPLLLAAAG